MTSKIKMKKLRFYVTGTNLFCLTKYPFFDPEVTGLSDASSKRGIESGSFPMSRSYGFNIKLKF